MHTHHPKLRRRWYQTGDVSRVTFHHNAMLKSRVVPENPFWPNGNIHTQTHTYEKSTTIFIEYVARLAIWAANTSYPTVGESYGTSYPLSRSTGGDTRVLEDDINKSSPEVWPTKTSSSPADHFPASTHPHNSLSSWCRSPLLPSNVLKHIDASFSRSKPLSQLHNCHGSLLSPEVQAQAHQHLHRRFASKFGHDGRAWDPEHARVMAVHYSNT